MSHPRIRGLIADLVLLCLFGAAWAACGLFTLWLVLSR